MEPCEGSSGAAATDASGPNPGGGRKNMGDNGIGVKSGIGCCAAIVANAPSTPSDAVAFIATNSAVMAAMGDIEGTDGTGNNGENSDTAWSGNGPTRAPCCSEPSDSKLFE